MTLAIFSQNLTINGKVTDKNNEPIIGASVILEGDATKGAATDVNGNFTLTNVRPNATLKVSYVGMKNQSVKVDGRNSIHIIMSDDTELLGEVVVTALGIKRNEKSLSYATQKYREKTY